MDDNDKQVTYGVSHLDGKAPIKVQFDASGFMLVDMTTSIQFAPTLNATHSYYPYATAVNDIDGVTIRPWVVNASTGAVLITTT